MFDVVGEYFGGDAVWIVRCDQSVEGDLTCSPDGMLVVSPWGDASVPLTVSGELWFGDIGLVAMGFHDGVGCDYRWTFEVTP